MFKFTNGIYNDPLLVEIRRLASEYDFTVDHTIDGLTRGADYTQFVESGWDQYFFNNLFKKVENVDLGLQPTERALREFTDFLTEQNEYVQYMSIFLDNLESDSENEALAKILIQAEKVLLRALRKVQIHKIKPRHSNGATIGCRKGSSIIDKTKDSGGIKHLLKCADRNHPYGVQLYWALQRIPYNIKGDDSNYIEIDAVPKTAKIDRIIGKGPTVTVAVQNGLGDLLEESLLGCGINMSTAQDTHKAIVLESSLTGEWSTLDLKGGSNNVYRALVYWLLRKRPDLIWLMNCISPSSFVIKKEERDILHTSHMLALQGNGFIMMFQTLLYYSLIQGIQRYRGVDYDVRVFGDDIIVHHTVAHDVIKVFNFLKLTINVDKSFIEPPFFESCGMDAIYGNNIRPLYVKDIPKQIDHWYRLANGIRRVCYYNNGYSWRSRASHDLWKWVVRSIPKNSRLYGPRIYGDAVLNLEASFLYTFGKPQRGDREYLLREKRGVKYPNEGVDKSGNPYSAERIKIRSVKQSSYKDSFGTSIKGLPANAVLQLAVNPALSGSGQKVQEVEGVTQYDESGNPMYRYPYVFNSQSITKQKVYAQYTPVGHISQDETVDDLFSRLSENGNEIITDTQHVIRVYNTKLLHARRELISVLSSIVAQREAAARVAKALKLEL